MPTTGAKNISREGGWWGGAGGSLLHLSIGQGDLLVTPLQMAMFASVLASKGNYIHPQIVNEEKKDKFLNKNFHSVTTKYNFLFNGNNLYAEGLSDLENDVRENFWTLLPLEKFKLFLLY